MEYTIDGRSLFNNDLISDIMFELCIYISLELKHAKFKLNFLTFIAAFYEVHVWGQIKFIIEGGIYEKHNGKGGIKLAKNPRVSVCWHCSGRAWNTHIMTPLGHVIWNILRMFSFLAFLFIKLVQITNIEISTCICQWWWMDFNVFPSTVHL